MGDGEPGRNLVVCMDGTGNAPKASGNTNVLRVFGMLENSSRQLTFYTPGVGTQGDPAALGVVAQMWTRFRGLVTGYGMRRDIADAYSFLIDHYRPGDRVFIFGFSRGAFAALSLAGLLRLYGIVRRESANMANRTILRYVQPMRRSQSVGTYRWRGLFAERVRDGSEWWIPTIEYLGLFDTVKALKYFRFWTRIREEVLTRRYHPGHPFTDVPGANVRVLRHAVSIDDRRIPYDVFRIQPEAGVDFQQAWFAGVHSDVGGGFEQTDANGRSTPAGLGRIALKWIIEPALERGLLLEDGKYRKHCAIRDEDADARIHANSKAWLLLGWRRRLARRPFRRRYLERPFWTWGSPPDAEVIHLHASVRDRTGWKLPPERPGTTYAWVDEQWRQPRPDGTTAPQPVP